MGASSSQPRTSVTEGNSTGSITHSAVDPWLPPVFTSRSETSGEGDLNKSEENQQHVSSSSLEREDEKQRVVDKLSREKEMELFHKELAEKRKQRQEVIAAKANEMIKLKKQVDDLMEKNEILEKENESLKKNDVPDCDGGSKLVDEELKEKNRFLLIQFAETQLSLQNANSELLLVTEERDELRKHIDSYKDVAKFSKNMLKIRDEELAQLKDKLSEIESSLVDRELQWLSNDLKKEYEKQLQDIRNLRTLYEERARISAQEKIRMSSELDEYKILLAAQINKTSEHEQRVEELEKQLSDKQSEVRELESQLGFSKAETRSLQQELTVINQLFSQALLGTGGETDFDMDRLVFLLEQNRDLLSDMAGTESEATSAMPRMLLDLVSQAQEKSDRPSNDSISEEGEENKDFPDEDKEEDTIGSLDNDNDNYEIEESSLEEELPHEHETRSPEPPKMSTAEAIVSRLPKVWRVLMELLNHQSGCPVTQDVPEAEENGGAVPKERGSACYKSVQTPTGPRLVLSVSKTYIRLKDLILEKKSLQKELSRLKQLNSHLETRLGSQERRLGNVSSELSHTWCLAGRMQRSYRTLHSHEQILRYELQQKRKMLNGLKQELQLCREKWQQARQKNTESEVEWKRLRSEFASRKLLDHRDGCGSAESGYSDERSDDSESETRDMTNTANAKSSDRITKPVSNEQPNENRAASEHREENAETSSASQEDQNSSRVEGVSPWKILEEGINSAKTMLERERILKHSSENENISGTSNGEQVTDNAESSIDSSVESSEEQIKNVNKSTSGSNLSVSLSPEGSSAENIDATNTDSSSSSNFTNTPSAPTADTSTSLESHENNLEKSSDNESQLENATATTLEENSLHNSMQLNTSNSHSSSATHIDATTHSTHTEEQNTSNSTSVDPPSRLTEQISPDRTEEMVPSTQLAAGQASSPADTPAAVPSGAPATERSPEEILSARDARLRRLEEQCKQLVTKVTRTSHRSVQLCTRLEELHEQYGREDQANVEQEDNTDREHFENNEIVGNSSQNVRDIEEGITNGVEEITTTPNENNTQVERIENSTIPQQECNAIVNVTQENTEE